MSLLKISQLRAVALPLAAVFFLAQGAQPENAAASAQKSPVASSAGNGCAAGAVESEPARRLVLTGVPNAGQVTETLLRGGQPTPQGFAELHKQGVEVVVNFRKENMEEERAVVEGQGMQYLTIPWDCHQPKNEDMVEFLEFVRDHPNEKIFVHCRYGIDRAGMMIAAYRMAEQGWALEQARREMVRFGFNYVHRSWCHQLKAYLAGFPTQLENDPKLQLLRATPATASPCTQ
jgi:protein-tyrosine phosphatase